jgi:hypothetical protein
MKRSSGERQFCGFLFIERRSYKADSMFRENASLEQKLIRFEKSA